jgi:hypothetical protein
MVGLDRSGAVERFPLSGLWVEPLRLRGLWRLLRIQALGICAVAARWFVRFMVATDAVDVPLLNSGLVGRRLDFPAGGRISANRVVRVRLVSRVGVRDEGRDRWKVVVLPEFCVLVTTAEHVIHISDRPGNFLSLLVEVLTLLETVGFVSFCAVRGLRHRGRRWKLGARLRTFLDVIFECRSVPGSRIKVVL